MRQSERCDICCYGWANGWALVQFSLVFFFILDRKNEHMARHLSVYIVRIYTICVLLIFTIDFHVYSSSERMPFRKCCTWIKCNGCSVIANKSDFDDNDETVKQGVNDRIFSIKVSQWILLLPLAQWTVSSVLLYGCTCGFSFAPNS